MHYSQSCFKKRELEEIVILEIPWQGFLAHGYLRNRDSGHVICSTSLVSMAAGKPGVSRETESVNNPNSLQALSALLSSQQDEEEEDEECKDVKAYARLGPGHIGPPPKKEKQVSTAYTKKNSKDIWCEEEVAVGSQYDDLTDPRPQPEYEIILKQSVGTEDLFLGLSRKDPSSMCCEAMLVKIKLPDTKATDVVLDVKEKFLDLRTPK
ncbi:protein PIH1D3 isoform X2 [Oreochromis aureus]|nr:protein PIH1D3 isoform X2 [Oreochromis aureus]